MEETTPKLRYVFRLELWERDPGDVAYDVALPVALPVEKGTLLEFDDFPGNLTPQQALAMFQHLTDELISCFSNCVGIEAHEVAPANG